jgi:hypothetical protein
MTALGAMRATWDGLAAEMHWSVRRWRRAIEPAVRIGMIEVNHATAYVGLPNWLRYNRPESPNVVKGAWIAALDKLPECPERRALARRCVAYLEAASAGFRQAVGDRVLDAFGHSIEEGKREGLADTMPQSVAVAVAVADTTPLTPLQEGGGEAAAATRPFTVEDLKNLWNQHAVPPMQKATGMVGKRLIHAHTRLREHREREFWEALFRRFAASSFVRKGGSAGTWRPSIDFVLKVDSILKILEGQFDDAVLERRRQTVDLDERARAVRALDERGRH